MTAERTATQTRQVLIHLEGRQAEDGRIPVVISTDAPVEMPDGVEVLDHGAGAIDLSRAPLPIVATHRGGQVNVGVVEDLVSDGHKLRGMARFGERDEAQQYARDVLNGTIRSVSAGYRRMKARAERSGVMVTTRWMPFHVAMVAEPADIGAGFYRESAEATPFVIEIEPLEPVEPHVAARSLAAEAAPAQPKENLMSDPTTAAPAAPTQPDIRVIASQAVTQERERADAIRAMGHAHSLADEASAAVRDGVTVDAFRELVLRKLEERGKLKPTVSPELGLSEREQRNFSVARLMYALLEPNDKAAQARAAFEIECSVEARKLRPLDEKGENYAHRQAGYTVPVDVLKGAIAREAKVAEAVRSMLAQRDLTVGTPTAGGNLVATDLLAGSFIDLLRNRMVLAQLGATVLDGLTGNIAIPSQTAGASTYWVAEGVNVTESQAAFGQVTMTPKTVGMFTDFSRKTLLQATPAIEALVRADLANGIACEIDRVGLGGSGSGSEPRGVINTAGIGAVAGGTNGAAPTYTHMVGLEEAVGIANADVEGMAYVTNAKMRAQLKLTQVFSGTSGEPVWKGSEVNGYRAVATNSMPSNLTKGTSSGVCSAIAFGNWRDLLLGFWSGLDLILDPYALATQGGRRIVALQDCDTAVRRAASFSAMLDALRV